MRRAHVGVAALVLLAAIAAWTSVRWTTSAAPVGLDPSDARDVAEGAASSDPAARPVERRKREAAKSDLLLAPTCLRGTVRDAADDSPVSDATVTWFRLVPSAGDDTVLGLEDLSRSPDGEVRTDDEGRFAADVPAGTHVRVLAVREGRGQASVDVAVPTSVSLELTKLRPVDVRFVDADSREPVGDVAVHVFFGLNSGPPVASARADAAGRVSISGAEGAWFLARAAGRVPRWHEVAAFDGPLEVALQRAAEISGQVVDDDGAPVVGATVDCDGVAEGDIRLSQRTDDQGRFRWHVVPDGEEREAHVAAVGFGPARVEMMPGEIDVIVHLSRGAWVEGDVVDETGKAVTEFKVNDGRVLGDGRFECGPLPVGVHRIGASPAREDRTFYGMAVIALRAGERRTDVRIVVKPNPERSVVRCRVVDPSGEPVPHAQIAVFLSAGTPEIHNTDADGRCELQLWSAPGTEFRARAEMHHVQWIPAAVVSGRSVATSDPAPPLDLRVAAFRESRLRFVDESGAEIPDRFVRVERTCGAGYMVEPGTLRIIDGARAVVRAEVNGRPRLVAEVSSSDVVDGTATVVVPSGHAVRGRVVVARRTSPPNLEATVRPVAGEATVRETMADRDGHFTIAGLPDGTGTLDVRIGGRVARRTFAVAGEDVDLGEIVVPALTAVHGIVVDERGAPVVGASVHFASAQVGLSATSGADGRFDATVPDGETLVLSAGRSPLRSHAREITAWLDGPPLRIELQREATVLVHASFAEKSGVGVYLRPARGEPEVELGRDTWGGPEFRVRMPAGSGTLRVTYGGQEWRRALDVPPGGVAELTLE